MFWVYHDWMSHADKMTSMPKGWQVLARWDLSRSGARDPRLSNIFRQPSCGKFTRDLTPYALDSFSE
jgi:hypothetical protein